MLVTTTTLPRSEQDSEPRFVIDLASRMRDRFESTVLAPAFPGANLQERLFGIEVIRFRYAPLRRWDRLTLSGGIMPRLRGAPVNWLLVPALMAGQRQAVKRLLREREFDLIHAHWTLPQGLIAATLPRSIAVPMVTTAHGGDFFALGSRRLRPLLRFVLRRAAAVTAVSENLCQTLRHMDEDVHEKLHCIPMGVDVTQFSSCAKESCRPGDMPTAPTILFVGRLVEKKGVAVLLEAMNILPETLADTQLVVIGDGPLRTSLVAHAAKQELKGRVHFLGAKNHAALPAYFAAANIFALPSISAGDGDKDGLPVTLMEAAACGLPSVASDIGGIPEFVRDRYNGVLVPPGDAVALAAGIEEMMLSPGVLSARGEAARETARSFDWQVIADRYAAVFDAAIV